MRSDGTVTLPTLRTRLTVVRNAQARGLRSRWSSGLLVPPDWLSDALESRALELESLVVQRVGEEEV